jgi:hypothetical protein
VNWKSVISWFANGNGHGNGKANGGILPPPNAPPGYWDPRPPLWNIFSGDPPAPPLLPPTPNPDPGGRRRRGRFPARILNTRTLFPLEEETLFWKGGASGDCEWALRNDGPNELWFSIELTDGAARP